MTDDVFLDFILGGIYGLLVWFFGGLDGLLKLLLALIVIDYLSGTLVAWRKNILSSSYGFYGICKKCVMLTFVGIAHLVDNLLPGDAAALRLAVCMFYIANEGMSIIENGDRLGIPIPKALTQHFSKLSHDDDEHEKLNEEKKA